MVKLFSSIIIVLSCILIFVSFKYKNDIKGKKNVVFLSYAVNVDNNEDDYCVEANLLANNLGSRLRQIYNVNEERYLYENATPRNLRLSLERVDRNCDFLVFYLGSHGGNEAGFFQAYLTDGNYKPRGTSYKHLTIRGKEIIDRIANLKIPALLIIDTCHSGSLMRDLANLPENISVICACSEKSCSYSWGLTEALLDGINGGADYDRNGSVTIRELQRYCYVNVVNFPTGDTSAQEIIHFGESDRVISLVN